MNVRLFLMLVFCCAQLSANPIGDGSTPVVVVTDRETAEGLIHDEGFVRIDLENENNPAVADLTHGEQEQRQVSCAKTCSNFLQGACFTLEIIGGAILLHPWLPSNLRIPLWSISTIFVGTFDGLACYAQKHGKTIDELLSSYELIAAGGAYFGIAWLLSALACG